VKVVASLGLQPSGKTTMSGSTGQSSVDQYTFVVGFIFGAQQAPTGVVSGQLTPHLVQGCEFTSHGFGFDVLIGRDIIGKCALSLSFDGHYSFRFKRLRLSANHRPAPRRLQGRSAMAKRHPQRH
jgi:hypothetical protein